MNFYPSINQKLLDDSIKFAKSVVKVSKDEVDIIRHSSKSLLFSQDGAWRKKGDTGLFDVTMGCFDGAEKCELVGLYLLNKLEKRFGKNKMGLYRDDGLGILENASGPMAERARKDLIEIFKKESLKITVSTNLTATDFLDVTFDLKENKFFPYRKPNNTILYVNKESNHPPVVLKEVPNSINKRISDISCDENEFLKAKPLYEEALKTSGFDVELSYCPNKKKKRKRRRKEIWFNPPFSVSVQTRVGKRFFEILESNFPKGHKFHRLLDRNHVKMSYSCMPNMGSIIKSHNKSILKTPQEETPEKSCNCRRPNECPMDGNCLVKNIVYVATVSSPGTMEKKYYGKCATTFKMRYGNHKCHMRLWKHRNKCELSKYIWYLKGQNKQFHIAWAIHKQCKPYREGEKNCDLCISEKLAIALSDTSICLNKKSEIVSTCVHKSKYMLCNVPT